MNFTGYIAQPTASKRLRTKNRHWSFQRQTKTVQLVSSKRDAWLQMQQTWRSKDDVRHRPALAVEYPCDSSPLALVQCPVEQWQIGRRCSVRWCWSETQRTATNAPRRWRRHLGNRCHGSAGLRQLRRLWGFWWQLEGKYHCNISHANNIAPMQGTLSN